jgi:hypothetical protein
MSVLSLTHPWKNYIKWKDLNPLSCAGLYYSPAWNEIRFRLQRDFENSQQDLFPPTLLRKRVAAGSRELRFIPLVSPTVKPHGAPWTAISASGLSCQQVLLDRTSDAVKLSPRQIPLLGLKSFCGHAKHSTSFRQIEKHSNFEFIFTDSIFNEYELLEYFYCATCFWIWIT